MRINSMWLCDGYKIGHPGFYPGDTETIYSNLTPRNTRRGSLAKKIVWFNLQGFIIEYLINQFNESFFSVPRSEAVRKYKRRIDNYLGKDAINYTHIGALHDLGYLPLLIKALPEGVEVPYGVPPVTIVNTKKEFFWVTNFIETMMSAELWGPCTSATTALQYRRVFEKYAKMTGSPLDFVKWQGHDFSMRGMFGVQAAALSGAGHLLVFTGTDTLPAIDYLEQYYGADCEKELIGGSVPASEHSVMCIGEPGGELETFRRLLEDICPDGILSVVSDTWNLWTVLTEYLPALKQKILKRNGKLVIRPDSGIPEKIVCGDPNAPEGSPQRKGVIELLWEVFGGHTTSTGHKMLDSHIGCIYGDGISPARQIAILQGLADKGFASGNMVMGLGSFTYQYTTRDVDGWAMKATWGFTTSRGAVAIFKKPITDDGSKTSAKGLLRVDKVNGEYVLRQNVTEDEEKGGELMPVFLDGRLVKFQTLAEIRANVERAV